MLSFDDHLAVAVSGGKDSLSILHILAKLKRSRPKTTLTAVTVDEGIKGYRDEALEIAAQKLQKTRNSTSHCLVQGTLRFHAGRNDLWSTRKRTYRH